MTISHFAHAQQSAGDQSGKPEAPDKIYEFSDVFLDVPKRAELERTEDGAVIAQQRLTEVDWGKAYRQMRSDINRMSTGTQNQEGAESATSATRSLSADELDFDRLVRDVRYAQPLLRSIVEPTLPVLLPANQKMLQVYRAISPSVDTGSAVDGNLVVFKGFRNHYAATYSMGSVSLLINGSRLSTRSSTLAESADRSRRMSDGTRFQPLERDDAGVSCAFERFGVVYTIEVVCDNPFIDSKCSEDAFIMDVYEKLLLFGGNPS